MRDDFKVVVRADGAHLEIQIVDNGDIALIVHDEQREPIYLSPITAMILAHGLMEAVEQRKAKD